MEPPTEFSPHPWDANSRQHTPLRRPRREQQMQHHQQQVQYQQQEQYQQEQYQQEQYQQKRHQQDEYGRCREQPSSRGRSSSRHQMSANGGNRGGVDMGQALSTHSGSNTPRRKGNPQSSSPSLDGSRRQVDSDRCPHREQQQQHQMDSSSQSLHKCVGGVAAGGPLTPLSALAAIMTSHSSHYDTALQLYRQSHSLHCNASDRTAAAMERLRQAHAEVEYATTAQEYAKEELERATSRKEEAHNELNAICRRVRNLSKSLADRRVTLVGLNKNVQWNGRLGTIVKLITDGEDVGRWKVKLDPEWRGRDAAGKRVNRCDTVSEESDGSERNNDNGDKQQDGENGRNVVVAKAENLELVKDGIIDDVNDMGAIFEDSPSRPRQRSASRSRSRSSQRAPMPEQDIRQSRSIDPDQEEHDYHHQKSHRPSRDPSISSSRKAGPSPAAVNQEKRGNNPSEARGPYKNISPTRYYKSKSGKYHESSQRIPHKQTNHPGQHPSHHTSQQNTPRKSSRQSSLKHVKNHPPPTHPSPSRPAPKKPSPFKLSPPRGVPRNSSIRGKRKQHLTPIRRSLSNDSQRISSAFSRMLLSPVSFTPVSFQPEPSDGFVQFNRSPGWELQQDKNELSSSKVGKHERKKSNSGGSWKQYGTSPGDVVSIAGSFFDEVTLLEKSTAFPYNEDDDNSRRGNSNDEFYNQDVNSHGETASDPQLQPYPSEDVSREECTTDGHGLPSIMVLPVPEDDYDNPFLSPGYSPSSPPHCVGVQNAGVGHVNGVYLLAYPKDEHGEPADSSDGDGTPPLYFRDGPPILLSDNRYYDMCILRINCPDSPDHVIWFLARVDVDPECLDVKFSDCYYYCRMLRNDDGCGGEREGGCQSPPSRGWNVPKLPPGVEMLRIAPSESFSTNDMDPNAQLSVPADTNSRHQHGLGIVPRMQGGGGEEDGDDPEIADFMSPGEDSGFDRSKMSEYSI